MLIRGTARGLAGRTLGLWFSNSLDRQGYRYGLVGWWAELVR